MVNGLGVLGWGVGGIEAEAAMLGQPISMLLPQVVGFKLDGELPEGATATDLVLTVTEMLRERGVVSKFVEFFGPGLHTLGLADRATIGNMSPEFGSTCAIFPVDAETLRYLEFTGRPTEMIELVDAYAREQGMFHDESSEDPTFSETLELDLGDGRAERSPARSAPRTGSRWRDAKRGVPRGAARSSTRTRPKRWATAIDEAVARVLPGLRPAGRGPRTTSAAAREPFEPSRGGDSLAAIAEHAATPVEVTLEDGSEVELDHGRVVIAAITSCTNTSNPSVMIGAGLLARKAVERGLTRKPWVKTSLAPGSTVVTDYLEQRRARPSTSTGSASTWSATAARPASATPGRCRRRSRRRSNENDLVVCAVLSGNRNFEGRINQDVEGQLPRLAAAVRRLRARRADGHRPRQRAARRGRRRRARLPARHLAARPRRSRRRSDDAVAPEMFTRSYADVFAGDERWRELEVPEGDRYTWPDSTYVRKPPFFEGMDAEPRRRSSRSPAPGCSPCSATRSPPTTSRPPGAIKKDSPAGRWLIEHGVEPRDFNSYGSRRGNHEVMIRGTFANIRLRNQLVEREGGFTRHFPDGEETTIYEAAMAYADEGVPLVVLAGKEYGSGSSRDWAAKGTALLGVRAVIAESFERIHRSNLIGMGVLPLQFPEGETRRVARPRPARRRSTSATSSGGRRGAPARDGARSRPSATSGDPVEFEARVRLDTPNEVRYFRNGGILHRVLRDLR